MRGNGKGRTAIIWSMSSTDNKESATFTSESPHLVVFGISFKVHITRFFFIIIII